MAGQKTRKAWRAGLALVLAAELSGCVSVSTTRTKATGPAGTDGSLEVAVYDTPAQARAGVASISRMSLELGRLEKDREEPLQTSSGSAWSFGSLPPAKYSLHLKAAAQEAGSASSAAPTITQESIKVAAGETVRTQVILKKFPTGAVVGAVLCLGAGIGIAYGVGVSIVGGLGSSHLSRSPAKKSPRAR